MKKSTLVSFAFIFIASIANAQINKGSLFIGGQISGFSSSSSTDNTVTQKQSSFFISPAIGTAIKQNLIAGADLTYNHSKYEDGNNASHPTNMYGGGIFLRKYVPLANRFYFFVQGRLGYSHSKDENRSGTYFSVNESNSASLGVYPGVAFALTKALYVEAGFNNMALISYSHSSYKSNSSNPMDQSSTYFNYNTTVNNTNFSFGLRFIIPKK